jgi:hypothetical protein
MSAAFALGDHVRLAGALAPLGVVVYVGRHGVTVRDANGVESGYRFDQLRHSNDAAANAFAGLYCLVVDRDQYEAGTESRKWFSGTTLDEMKKRVEQIAEGLTVSDEWVLISVVGIDSSGNEEDILVYLHSVETKTINRPVETKNIVAHGWVGAK